MNAATDFLSRSVPYLLSWVVLTPIAIIVAGKLLNQRIALTARSDDQDIFSVRIPGLLIVRATDSEVVLGLAGFFFTFFAVAIVFGASAYTFFKEHFGVDPEQWNSLCILSSFGTVVWAFIAFLIISLAYLPGSGVNRSRDDIIVAMARRRHIQDLSQDKIDNDERTHEGSQPGIR